MKSGVQKMLWIQRYADYFDTGEPEVIFSRRSFMGYWKLLPTDFFFWLQALLGQPLRISFALERVHGASVVVPRLPNA